MIRVALTFFVAASLMSQNVSAQSTTSNNIDPAPYVRDINAISTALEKKALSARDVSNIAKVTCTSMQRAKTDHVATSVGNRLISKRYPTKEEFAKVNLGAFKEFEHGEFNRYGISASGLALTDKLLDSRKSLSEYPPPKMSNADTSISEVESVACNQKIVVSASSVPASSRQVQLAVDMGNAVISVGIMVVDASVVAESLGTVFFAAISMSYGWDQLKESGGRLRDAALTQK